MFIVQRIVRFSWKNVLQLGKKLVFLFGVHNIIIMVVQKMKQKFFFFRQNTQHQIIVGRKVNFSSLYISTTNNNCFLMFFLFNFPHFWYYIRKLKYITRLVSSNPCVLGVFGVVLSISNRGYYCYSLLVAAGTISSTQFVVSL